MLDVSRKKIIGVVRSARFEGFDYTLACGHIVRGKDYRRMRNKIWREPKTAHCDECPK